jgi:hypothetical protein
MAIEKAVAQRVEPLEDGHKIQISDSVVILVLLLALCWFGWRVLSTI